MKFVDALPEVEGRGRSIDVARLKELEETAKQLKANPGKVALLESDARGAGSWNRLMEIDDHIVVATRNCKSGKTFEQNIYENRGQYDENGKSIAKIVGQRTHPAVDVYAYYQPNSK